MNTAKLKKYAPKARREFISAVSKQLNQLGIYSDKQISDVKEQGSVLSIEGKAFPIGINTARERLVRKVKTFGYTQLIEQVAYTWFNRLCAIRYMEIHDYLGHGFRVLSHPDNPKGFEIIDHAQDAADDLGLDRARIIELKLAGNKDEELYRELLLGQCHKLHEAMPFLFDALDDETELLLPDNLTRTDSILRGLVDGIPEEDWQQVEVIGWLYQFYISEKKDQVIGKVVKSEDIPAATQLFTPNWIVKYLVQNSVGRQWLGTYPQSDLLERLKEIDKKKKQKIALLRGESNVDDIKGEVFYIHPAEQIESVKQQLHSIVPESIEPEIIKVLDPACGSGHILIEAYNVLKAIYEERGFRSRDIPKMILENNLYGLDIDDRAAQLSGFALMMMARDDDKRIFTRNVRLNVLSLQESNHIDLPTLWKALNLSGSWQSGTSQDMFSIDTESNADDCMEPGGRAAQDAKADNRYQLLKRTLERFTQAKTFGSLIDVPTEEHEQLKELMRTLVELQESGDSMQKSAAKQLIEFVHQALVLSIRYDAVIANPPYMGSKGMNSDLKKFAKDNFPDSKLDLFACMQERGSSLSHDNGYVAMIVMESWMFLSSYENLRLKIVNEKTILDLIHMPYSGKGRTPLGINFGTSASIIQNSHLKGYKAKFSCTRHFEIDDELKPKVFPSPNERLTATVIDNFNRIPGAPIAYWVVEDIYKAYDNSKLLKEVLNPKQGMATGDNDSFLRYWWEVNWSDVSLYSSSKAEHHINGKRYARYNKGGEYRKWYGNNELLIKFNSDDYKILKEQGNHCPSENLYFNESLTWSDLTTKAFGARFSPVGAVFDVKGSSGFPNVDKFSVLGLLCSNLINYFMKVINPTMTFQVGDLSRVPYITGNWDNVSSLSKNAVDISRENYSLRETCYDFNGMLVQSQSQRVADSFREEWNISKRHLDLLLSVEMQVNKEINKLYQVEGIVDDAVDIDLITLAVKPTCQSFNSVDEDDEFRGYLSEKLVSISIGNMMGRYSLKFKGLHQITSNNLDFSEIDENDTSTPFKVDEDGIIPLTDQEWFKDDATNRFREFVQAVWGEEHLQENLDFVAESLCLNAIKPKKSESALETIRRYLSTQFYKDHLKTYKKRPIYWLFSSGKQKAFECLVYLHRYNEGTLSRMRTEYVTPLLGKYDAYAEQLEKQIETADSTSEANRFKKELDALTKKQVELREFDDKLKHYADMRISLDLDDGVKVNYGKFGDLLADVKVITGSAPEVN
ncbi:BREX-1 system adenine-specific DNA-methyltransferase PglX [Vibrio cholerae]|uniref:BREX-1 system adenine-specific DNA-methyltransferase PglX n=1 Tax=Vibrio cholerae TaxID=666 RepID=UPI00247A2E5C|nr:BREX-1 system adenine-specific DNA-methyltransferase PglX [Vibrio cholerae]MDH7615257.1 BREX-1 system adenine-specific DNA-methyltransferase PglX [Vibrio cholerae]